jgi:hypothetical protein
MVNNLALNGRPDQEKAVKVAKVEKVEKSEEKELQENPRKLLNQDL